LYNGIKRTRKTRRRSTDYFDDKESFSPRKGCPIDDEKINDNLRLITVDSQWFLEDWNKTPTINDDCSIKSREVF
jgi:hypothetical protein